ATLEVLPGNRSAHIAVARCALERGDLVEAKRHYARALAIRPHDMPTTMRLVEVLTRLGRVGEAEAHYADMLSRRPADATLRFNYAGLLASTGRTEDAIRELRRVLDIDPEFEAARRRLAILRRGQKEHE
ncbi:MAG: tetratricopeptide repeat protein, partial [Phycisphaerae bacterium]